MMFIATIMFLALGDLSFLVRGQEDHGTKPLEITLFYESYCPGCIEYMRSEVKPAWEKFHANLILDLVPFGNAMQWYVNGHFKFECQHGPKECVANKLHACAIHAACGEGGTKKCAEADVSRVLQYIQCLEAAEDQEKANNQCAKSVQLKPGQIAKCAGNREGEQLLSSYGNVTSAFSPKVEYVPFVAMNGKHDTKAENDLTTEICKLRPSLCSGLEKPFTNNIFLK